MYSVELTRSSLPTSRVSHDSSSLLEYAIVLYRPLLILKLSSSVTIYLETIAYQLSSSKSQYYINSIPDISEIYYGIVYNISLYFLVIFFRFFYIDLQDIGPRKVDSNFVF
jgi:preprotein translocase subunit SecY